MYSEKIYRMIQVVISILLVSIIPFWPPLISPVIGLLILNWLFGAGFVRLFRKEYNWKMLLLFGGFFLLYAIGLLWTQNVSNGMRQIETKMGLLILPLIYFCIPLTKTELRLILRFFLYAVLTGLIYLFANATWNFFYTRYLIAHGADTWNFGINFFLKDRFSPHIHPSYLAMYLSFAIWIMADRDYKEIVPQWFRIAVTALCAFSILLLSSKAGIIVLAGISFIMLYNMIVREKKVKRAIIIIGVFISSFLILFFSAPQFRLRFEDAIAAIAGKEDVKTSEESTAARVAVWKAAWEIVKEHPLSGVGTGSAGTAMDKKLEELGMTTAKEEHLNAHNMFFQAWITVGIAGVLWLIAMLLLPMRSALREKNYLYFAFLLILLINIFVESMFDTVAGAGYFALFNALIFTGTKFRSQNL